ncbi:TPA: hypothetical protein ACXLBO_002400 [Pseudomonas aeruginosa]
MFEIERYFKLFSLPVFFIAIGLIGMTIMTADGFHAIAVLAQVIRLGFFISLGISVTGLIWMGWRLLLRGGGRMESWRVIAITATEVLGSFRVPSA